MNLLALKSIVGDPRPALRERAPSRTVTTKVVRKSQRVIYVILSHGTKCAVSVELIRSRIKITLAGKNTG